MSSIREGVACRARSTSDSVKADIPRASETVSSLSRSAYFPGFLAAIP